MINKLEFSIDIKASRSVIWNALWDEDNYRNWTEVFFEGSYVVTDNWKEGSKVWFLSPDKSGIYSLIESHITNKQILFRHIGNVVEGKEQPVDAETKKWTGASEAYTLSEGIDACTLKVEIDVMDEHLEFMKKTMPRALERIKLNCG